MKKKKLGRRIMAAAIVATLLPASMTVSAATVPTELTNLEKSEDNVGVLWGYVDSLMDGASTIYTNTNTTLAEEKKYFEKESNLVPSNKLEAAEQALGTAEQDFQNNFDAAKQAVIDLYNTTVEADGTCYISDDMWAREEAVWNKVDAIDKKLKNDTIIRVENGETEPDVSTMDSGTGWVSGTDVDAFWNAIEQQRNTIKDYKDNFGDEQYEDWKTFTIHLGRTDGNWDEEKATVPASTFESYVSGIESAYNEFCGKIHEGTKKTETPSTEQSAASDEITEKKTEQRAEANPKQEPKQEQEPEPVPVNQVVASSGVKNLSKIDGVYGNAGVCGVIYANEQAAIKQAAGLTETEIKNGAVVKYYVCKCLNKKMNQMLEKSLTDNGYKLICTMNNDLYKLHKGEVIKIRTTSEALTVLIGVPEHLRNDKYEFVIMCYDESGNLVILPDLDTDKATITVQSTHFGYWAVGYKEKR